MTNKIFIFIAGILLFFQTSLKAQPNDMYKTNWENIRAFEKNGLTASARKEAEKIYSLAKKDGQEAQLMKAVLYLMAYRNQLEEDQILQNIRFADSLLKDSKAPVTNLLYSLKAELCGQYLQQNRYRLYEQTTLEKEESSDISTWSITKLVSTISQWHLSSLSDPSILKKTSIESWDPILEKGKNTRNLRPTLFDFLSHRALGYFMNDESGITKPADRFLINQEQAFAPARDFIATRFISNDSSSSAWLALHVLQGILAFHLNDAKPDALIDADLIRLAYVYQHAVMLDKDKLYENSLRNLESQFGANAVSSEATYLRAKLYAGKGRKYDPVTFPSVQFDLKRAKETCEEVITKFPGSEGAIHARQLMEELKTPGISLETELVNLPDMPFRSLLRYRNLSKVYLRVIKSNHAEIDKSATYDYQKQWKELIALKADLSWEINLPDLKDLQEHATEIKINSLAPGVYYLLASGSPDFTLSNNLIARQIIHVSQISYVQNNRNDMYVLNRNTGEPLEGATVERWEKIYNQQIRKNEDKKTDSYTTNKQGYIQLSGERNYRQVRYRIIWKKEILFTDDHHYMGTYREEEESKTVQKTFFFTDRSIYRPGQKVFFKGIVIDHNLKEKTNQIKSGYQTEIILTDANGQKVAGTSVTTNEYGSFHGIFTLPATGLTGSFTITDSINQSQESISVEEYKRPKFLVTVQSPSGTYRLNDTIAITGNAKAYAGNMIDGATVSYRVTRKTVYPLWWGYGMRESFRRPWFPGRQEEMEIINGETETDANGDFLIRFKAIPDEESDKKGQPVFYYEVSADVTDVNGETRSGSNSVAVAYQAVKLEIDLADKLHSDSLTTMRIRSRNMNDLFEKASVNLQAYELAYPKRFIRNRYWSAPDVFVMGEEEYIRNFPHDAYKNEDKTSAWPTGKRILDITDSTSTDGTFRIPVMQWTDGWYKVIAITTDKYGEESRAEKIIRIKNGSALLPNDAVVAENTTPIALPGTTAQSLFQSAFDRSWLLYSTTRQGQDPKTELREISQKSSWQLTMPVTEKDRGGINISYSYVKHNRVYTGQEFFIVPWDNKKLTIGFETFRDKTLPGSEESWTVRISGMHSEKIAAEALISMYDASLDQFQPHTWTSLHSIWPVNLTTVQWEGRLFRSAQSVPYFGISPVQYPELVKQYDALLDNGWNNSFMGLYSRKQLDQVVVSGMASPKSEAMKTRLDNEKDEDDKTEIKETPKPVEPSVKVRKNFNETAFFFPELRTAEDGSIKFSFTIPEALTQWKLMALAHNADLATGYAEKMTITQKPLMVQPNAPRFLREGDELHWSVKVVNLSEQEIKGTAHLELIDASNGKPVDGWFKNVFPVQHFSIEAGKSLPLSFPIGIPSLFGSALTWRVTAISNNNQFSDGEEATIPVLSNRMLVTESYPINLRGKQKDTFRFSKLVTNQSPSLSHQSLTVEYTSNPAWFAVQSLPYLMEFPYDCAEQQFNRFYANILASHIANRIPSVRTVFEKWKTIDTAALLSNLQKNQELKSALLEETPWVLEAQSEQKQKEQIALLFDMVRLSNEKNKTWKQLKEMQLSNGGFSWFAGGPDNRYITQYIVAGIGHLKKLGALNKDDDNQMMPVIQQAIRYLDDRLADDHRQLILRKANLKKNQLTSTAIHYLYARSFYTELKINKTAEKAWNFYQKQSSAYWLSNSKNLQAMIALTQFRNGNVKTAKSIIRSLSENAIRHPELGMYWKDLSRQGYYWHQSPIENQALMIEAFSDISRDNRITDDLKTWLLKQKQTRHWGTTKATAEACYALLLNGTDWLKENKIVEIRLGSTLIDSRQMGPEAGTGYFKERIPGEKVTTDMGNISVSISGSDPGSVSSSWGSVYWQYWEDLNKITPAATPLSLVKKIFIQQHSPAGPVLKEVKEGDEVHIGDKLITRIELRTDRDMEFLHIKDMRGSCLEPVNVLSGYKWKSGFGYYESTRDAASHFFIDFLPRGTYVFEYPSFVTHQGQFSNGISSIQTMYAPEFSSHSEGINVRVAE